jgi:hemin uptake protein HemP
MRRADVERPAAQPGGAALPHAATAAAAPAAATGGVAGRSARPACISSAQLFGGALEVHIDHHGAVYRLKQTALGKLILTK